MNYYCGKRLKVTCCHTERSRSVDLADHLNYKQDEMLCQAQHDEEKKFILKTT